MNIRVGFIPYLNMAPFHRGFGPKSFEEDGYRFEFHSMSPRVLGLEAEKGAVDAGAMSLVDALRLSDTFEPLGRYGIGLKKDAQSVLVFSKKPLSALDGVCAVTDETATSFRLLQVILEAHYGRTSIHYGRIASAMLFDGEAEALLLIGDEALKAKQEGIRGLPIVTDLGQEWYEWQKLPFVFARWVVRRNMPLESKVMIEEHIKNSLNSTYNDIFRSHYEAVIAKRQASGAEAICPDRSPRSLQSLAMTSYWEGFAYELTPEHEQSIARFARLMEKVCLTV